MEYMNTELITLNECQNDGYTIHLYYNPIVGIWTAYGISAYALRLFGKTHAQYNQRGFAEDLQMPCTVADKHTIDILFSTINKEVLADETYLKFRLEDKIDTEAYRRWAAKLRNNKSANTDDDIAESEPLTPVSSKIPKEGYIKDGMSPFSRTLKRFLDFTASFIALIVFSPLYFICWAAIKLDDGGPAIFKQERIGRFGRPFYIYKFRSMRLDAEKAGPMLSTAGGDNDSRLTKVGAFLRRHHLDELPQLWNVFIGDMSFVGPRPERKYYIDQIIERDKRYRFLYQIRPGVTSYATLYNGYTDTMEKMLRRLEYDLYYLGHRSGWFDVKILLKTFYSIISGRKF